MSGSSGKRRKVLAVASGGGHWVQLMRLSHILKEHDVAFVTVSQAYQCDVDGRKLYSIVDATAWNKFKLLWQAFQLLVIVFRERPDVVISTGAARAVRGGARRGSFYGDGGRTAVCPASPTGKSRTP